ncbi:hypothetical protein GQ602_002600 [Ophiocordyceps camponoti-floridani]|uniref:Uncharacterized protein n=1 Tax=Ophiocordyceps camponoti-floridani TaxID=2030778 RepID=A0A8H4VFI9_9HYPO|nr:hypothetical protein GQ602_002600 [Ophiocordyceps camponoti-floridani]
MNPPSSTDTITGPQSQESQPSQDDSSISLEALAADCILLRHVSIRSAELACHASPPQQPASALPLEAYLMDQNDHERRLLRLSLSTELLTSSADDASKSESPWSTWESAAEDEPKRCSSDPLPSEQRSAPTPNGVRSEPDSQQKMSRYLMTPSTTTSWASSPARDSVLSDVVVSGSPLADRHLPLHLELQQAGFAGLGDGFSSGGAGQSRTSAPWCNGSRSRSQSTARNRA